MVNYYIYRRKLLELGIELWQNRDSTMDRIMENVEKCRTKYSVSKDQLSNVLTLTIRRICE